MTNFPVRAIKWFKLPDPVSRVSKKGEIKLLGVAMASLEELLADYEDFLRQKKLLIWGKTDPKITKFRQLAFKLSNLSNQPAQFRKPELQATFALCHQATFLLDRQIKKAEDMFIKEGGYTENLFKSRLKVKINRD